MSKFIVVAFADEASARQGVSALKDLALGQMLTLHGAAIVTKDEERNLSMDIVSETASGTVAAGALIGGLAGLGVGFLAAAFMAAGGAALGASAVLTNRGAGRKFREQVGRRLKSNSAAIVADVDVHNLIDLQRRMEAIGGAVHLKPLGS